MYNFKSSRLASLPLPLAMDGNVDDAVSGDDMDEVTTAGARFLLMKHGYVGTYVCVSIQEYMVEC